MKKICFVDYDMSVTGGVEQVTTSLANRLCTEYEIHIFSIHCEGGEPAYELDEKIYYHQELKSQKRLRESITETFRPFCNYVKKHQIDIVVMMGNYPALIVSFTRFFTTAKYVYCDHGGLMNQWHQKDITAIRFWDALTAHKVIVLTEQTRQDYMKQFHLKQKKVECIYNWVMPELLENRESYHSDSKKILTVGRFGKEKGYDLLLETAKKCLSNYTDWEWHLYGTGETFDAVRQKAIEYGLEKQLIFKGNVKEAYRFYKEYAFLVLPSYREGLPLVLLEASAIGLPMISFDIQTGPNEVIVDGENGFLIPPYDCSKMAEAIERLICDEELRIRQSENTKRYVEKFECTVILDKWKHLFEQEL